MGPLLGVLLSQAMHGAIAGRILEAETAQPVAGAVVSIADVGRTTAADDCGRYVLQGIPFGLTSKAPDLAPEIGVAFSF